MGIASYFDMDTKQCTLCRHVLPIENFAKKKNSTQARCRVCHALYTRDHYQKNKEYYKAKAGSNLPKIKAFVNAAKSVPCVDCNVTYPYYVMDFDHVRGEKFMCISTMKMRAHGLTALKKEIAKCEVVCANCHRIRTYKRLSLRSSAE